MSPEMIIHNNKIMWKGIATSKQNFKDKNQLTKADPSGLNTKSTAELK
jgi:hypothetical protein